VITKRKLNEDFLMTKYKFNVHEYSEQNLGVPVAVATEESIIFVFPTVKLQLFPEIILKVTFLQQTSSK
jgi:hypothetical protein